MPTGEDKRRSLSPNASSWQCGVNSSSWHEGMDHMAYAAEYHQQAQYWPGQEYLPHSDHFAANSHYQTQQYMGPGSSHSRSPPRSRSSQGSSGSSSRSSSRSGSPPNDTRQRSFDRKASYHSNGTVYFPKASNETKSTKSASPHKAPSLTSERVAVTHSGQRIIILSTARNLEACSYVQVLA